jgi:hypothetical protein
MYGIALGVISVLLVLLAASWNDESVDAIRTFAANPVYALFAGGLISLLVWNRQEHLIYARERRLQRRKLYADFVAQVEQCTARSTDRTRENWHLKPEIRRLWSLQSQVALEGRASVTEASATVVTAINDYWMRDGDRIISKDGKSRTLWDNVATRLGLALRL